MNEQNLILNWTFDIPNQKLFIKIADDLEYEALEGGTLGYKKTYKGEVTTLSPDDWVFREKHWISENYGEIYGHFQPTLDLYVPHPENGHEQHCPNGLGLDGEYLDHLQRSQYLLEGHDCATVFMSSVPDLYQTPDNGLTIYVRRGYNDVLYAQAAEHPDWLWIHHPQPCLQQPRAISYQLSSHQELEDAGCPQEIVDKCKRGEWDSPRHPEFQQYYIYPTA